MDEEELNVVVICLSLLVCILCHITAARKSPSRTSALTGNEYTLELLNSNNDNRLRGSLKNKN
jgi:hypothetical protein